MSAAQKIEPGSISGEGVPAVFIVFNQSDKTATTSKVEYDLFGNDEFLGHGILSYEDIPPNGRPQFLPQQTTTLNSPIVLEPTDSNLQLIEAIPWHEKDPIYSLRTWDEAAVALIGVNEDVTAFNVQIWGLPTHYIEILRRKYGTGKVKFPKLNDSKLERWCIQNEIPLIDEYELGSGVITDKIHPPIATMEIPFTGYPRKHYIELLKSASSKDIRTSFDRPYRCKVITQGELAFPGFENSLYLSYPDAEGKETSNRMYVYKEPILTDGSQTGWYAKLMDPPKDYYLKISFVDLSRPHRPGSVIMTAVLTKDYRRRVIEIARGSWAPQEVSGQLVKLFERHDDLALCYIESVALQSFYVGELKLHKEAYPFWQKIASFEKTTTSKNDEQIGILTMGITLASGGFEIPDTRQMSDHGFNCQCGYCVLISDGMFQPRLAPVNSDLLVSLWGLHIQMPHSYEPIEPMRPTGYQSVSTGMDLLKMGAGNKALFERVLKGEGNDRDSITRSVIGVGASTLSVPKKDTKWK